MNSVEANWATSLTLDVNIRIGGLDVPRGHYSLFLLPREDGGELIVNRQTRQWGTDYDSSLARIIHEEADYSRKTNAPVWYKGCAHRPFATTEALA